MDEITKKRHNFEQALKSLKASIEHYRSAQNASQIEKIGTINKDELLISLRDSMIQRFEYTTEICWKFIKSYLEVSEKAKLQSSSPREVFRTACNYKIFTETEVENFLRMLDSRNLTSHMYKEEVAEILLAKIPVFFDLLTVVKDRIKNA
jgi:nucleotidyltransferase substrate binding protein (TIGR01987 family)